MVASVAAGKLNLSVISFVLVSMSSSAGTPLLVHCTVACVASVLFCILCLVSLVGALHFVLVSVLFHLVFGAGSP